MNESEKSDETQHRDQNVELINQILNSNDKHIVDLAMSEFYSLNNQKIHNFILKKLGNAGNWRDAEELTNDTFRRTFIYMDTVREPKKIMNWMYAVAKQRVASWFRENDRENDKRIQIESLTDVSEFEVSDAFVRAYREDQQQEREEILREKLRQAIDQLPELERSIFDMLLQDKSYEEIYAELREVYPSLKPSSVRNRVSRTKEKLKAWAEAWKEQDSEGYDLEFSEFMENQN